MQGRGLVCLQIIWLACRSMASFALLDMQKWDPKPGAMIPYGIVVPVLNGNYTLDPTTGEGLPLVVMAYDESDAFSRYMWSSKASVQEFVQQASLDVNYLFVSYGAEPLVDATYLQGCMVEAVTALGLHDRVAQRLLARLFFAQPNLAGLSDTRANFLPYLLDKWPSPRKVVAAEAPGGWEAAFQRLDASPEWLPWAPPGGLLPVAYVGDGCLDPWPLDLAGRLALTVPLDSATPACSPALTVSKAQAAGAAGVVVAAANGSDLAPLTCIGGECALPLQLFATQVPFEAGRQLWARAIGPSGLRLGFKEQRAGGYFVAVDDAGHMQEVGWEKEATLLHLAWAAQWLTYQQELRQNLSGPALIVPIFDQEVLQGDGGLVADVVLPPAAELARHDTLHLDFTLGCPGDFDAECPTWDHVVQLFALCEDPDDIAPPPDPCAATVWHPVQRGSAAADPREASWRARHPGAVANRWGGALCGRELGRWVTPFRRRIGRWLTDVSPLRPLLGTGRCRFRLQTAPWALPWKPSLSLRFSNASSDWATKTGGPAARMQAVKTIRLFDGGAFDASYNDRKAARFRIPHGVERVLLQSVITGHGSDENNCAEFCATSHGFTVNGATRWVNYTEAGTERGCADRVREGIIPNEHGTWLYGRNGWCDGQNVRPWVVDITGILHGPGGEENVISYVGLFNGTTPNPQAKPGYIMMQSHVIFQSRHAADLDVAIDAW